MYIKGCTHQTSMCTLAKFVTIDAIHELKCMDDKCTLVACVIHSIYDLCERVYHTQCITGIAHALIDDDNFDDDTIHYVKNNIDKSRVESPLILLLCDTLESMSHNQRTLGYALASDVFCGVECHGVCTHCKLKNIYE